MTLKDIGLALLVPLCWGLGFTMAKPAIAHFPPLFIMTITYAGNAVLIALIWRGPRRTPHWAGALIASCSATIQGALIFYGYQFISASLSNLIVQTQVPAAVLFGWLLLGEKLNLRKIAGIAIAFAGVVMILGLPEEPPPLWPVVLIIAGGAVWALGQVFARKFGRDDGILLLRTISMHAAPQLLLATLLLEKGQLESLRTATPFEWIAAGCFAFIGFFCAYALWYTVLRRNRVDEVMPFMLLMPIVGVFIAWAVLGEPLTIANLAGGAVILIGVATVIGFPARQPRVAEACS